MAEQVAASRTGWEMIALAMIAVLGILVITVMLFMFEVREGARELLYIIVGGLMAKLSDVFGFFFGSSRGSKDKDAILAMLKDQRHG